MTASLFELADHAVRQLGRDDVPAIRHLFETCADYFHLIDLEPAAEAEQIFDAAPPNKRPEDVLVFGVYAASGRDRIIALVELLRGYPTQDDWYLGLLLILPTQRSKGLGAATVAALIRYVSLSGARNLHLGVLDQNPRALRFWQRHGFVMTGTTTLQAANGTNQVARLVLALSPELPPVA